MKGLLIAIGVAAAVLLFPGSIPRSLASDRLNICVVNYPLKYFAERIGGDHVSVILPIPRDVDPAYWTPDVATIAALQKADLIFLNGAGYAGWVDKVSLPLSRVVNTSKAFSDRYLTSKAEVTHSHGPTGEHTHENLAFTTWLDFDLAARQAEAVATALSRKNPAYKEMFTQNFQPLKDELKSLDAAMSRAASRAPETPLIASHPVYDYLVHRYRLNLKSVHWEPHEFPRPKQWLELQEHLTTHPATCMIWESQPLAEIEEKLHTLGLKCVVFDPCGNVPEAGDFLTVMQQNAENLRAVFK